MQSRELDAARLRALSVYQSLAAKNDPFGLERLGAMHLYGVAGLTRNETEALRYFRKSAEQNYGIAFNQIGVLQLSGWGGLTQNPAEAMRSFHKAADHGVVLAMMNIGSFYLHGSAGLSQNDTEAAKWFLQGSKNVGATAASFMAAMNANGLSDVATTLYRPIEANEAKIMVELAMLYELGRGGLAKNVQEALHLYRTAADKGNSLAFYGLGVIHEEGRYGVSKDEAEAMRFYALAQEDVPKAKEKLQAIQNSRKVKEFAGDVAGDVAGAFVKSILRNIMK